ncbi:glycerate kinase type-2 family protein [Ahrensia marina]|uniref:MOFRL domain-containing protein n=1 Tax=Ahrensia marina TaxID=1514904 RepID=A0A0M9GMA1_9HYPH|nr:DUF4147 domain-containing protein [Ahrensia marina]KPB00776.1 hypothetical protein SU32_12250 [Ahrensia marina]
MTDNPAAMLEELWWQGVDAVRGFSAVTASLSDSTITPPDMIIAVGKAAGDMALGARKHFATQIPTLVVTKYDHTRDELAALSNCEIIEAGHPVPDQNSLTGGARVLEAVQNMAADQNLLLLVSGGASALVEVLEEGQTLDSLKALNKGFLADGLSIGEINAERRKISRIKGGRLLDAFKGKSAHVIAISDVEGDSIDVIASGIGAYHGSGNHIEIKIAASNAVARQTIEKAAQDKNIDVQRNEECLYGHAEDIAPKLLDEFQNGPVGLYIFGGEPTVELPDNPGRGGRNQHLALLLADKIKTRDDLHILIAGTDGTDGPTAEAGAIIDGSTVKAGDDTARYLRTADAGTYLNERGASLTTGPTGTNVMDIVLVLKT